jgi:heme exporter protein A
VQALALQSITKSFGPVRALDEVSLTVARGETLAVFGPNGAGKTTLLKIAATLIRPNGGRVLLFGDDPLRRPALRALIGFVSHHSYLYPGLTARENLLFAARLYGRRDAPARVAALLDAVGLTARADDLVRTFSRGMTQRLSIARALVHDPPILLLDEPYTGLDRTAAGAFTALLRAMRGSRTVVLTTHSIEQGVALADRVVILVDGAVAYEAANGGRDAAAVERAYAACVGVPA